MTRMRSKSGDSAGLSSGIQLGWVDGDCESGFCGEGLGGCWEVRMLGLEDGGWWNVPGGMFWKDAILGLNGGRGG